MGFAVGQAAVLWYKDKALQKKVNSAPTFSQKAKLFFNAWLHTNKEMVTDVKNFDYEGKWEDVKAYFADEVKNLEEKLNEFEAKVAEWKDKANDMAHAKAEEIGTMIQEKITDIQSKLMDRWDDINEKGDVKEKVETIKKKYEQVKKVLAK